MARDERIIKPKNQKAIPQPPRRGVSAKTIEDIRNQFIKPRTGVREYRLPTEADYHAAAWEYVTTGRKPMLMIRDEIIKKRGTQMQDAIAKVKAELGI